MIEPHINKEALANMRKRVGASQKEMAHHMRMPFRTYQALENGENPIRLMHIRSFEAGLLWLARKNDDASILPEHLKELVSDLFLLIENGNILDGER
ncbi:XRE family transcriptional regulator [Mesorhizobium sp. M2A.F.Ca.ET.042.01.1.1]|uniref:helix-turn-helix domain-containing protein n=1 Tax=Mesorhizobium sp. M2A.F.Ca.ET.042.01.1.1 TaxID=2496745 RepID=UPI000FCACBAD|nr:helix-turn-helix transcriptional regulator [Mesorhizobium sp. M2A.F.Ca.ET.042.01.1.1]RUX33565.1 XRE family transcriptional regulator [Mesorhizobium sp. M2A.F.Ca.ET.042.01.1.1]